MIFRGLWKLYPYIQLAFKKITEEFIGDKPGLFHLYCYMGYRCKWNYCINTMNCHYRVVSAALHSTLNTKIITVHLFHEKALNSILRVCDNKSQTLNLDCIPLTLITTHLARQAWLTLTAPMLTFSLAYTSWTSTDIVRSSSNTDSFRSSGK